MNTYNGVPITFNLLTWIFWSWVNSFDFHGNSLMWYLLFSFQSRSFKQEPQECVYCPLFYSLARQQDFFKSSFPCHSQGRVGEKHFPRILLMYLSSWLYLCVCFQNTACYSLHNLEAGILCKSLHLHENLSPFSCRHQVAVPCPSSHS